MIISGSKMDIRPEVLCFTADCQRDLCVRFKIDKPVDDLNTGAL